MKAINKITYIIPLLLFAIFSYGFVDANLQYFNNFYTGFSNDQKTITTILYGIFVIFFFVFYLLILRKVKTKHIHHNDIKWYIGTTSVVLLLAYPAMLSYDIFNYILTSKVLVYYHENPYIVMPIEFNTEPYLAFTRAANKIALYGPSWIFLSTIPYISGFGNFLLTLFSFKLFIAAFYLGACFVFWKLAKNLFSLAVFALNPLVIIEALVGAHNDIVMMFLVLLSYLLLQKKKVKTAVLVFVASIFIKYAVVFLVPVFAFAVYLIVSKNKIKWKSIYFISALSMLLVFFLSPLREELYPWYAIWFLPFAALVPERKIFFILCLSLSFSLLLRYIPFMALGTYSVPTPAIRILLTFSVPLLVVLYLLLSKKIWLKKSSR